MVRIDLLVIAPGLLGVEAPGRVWRPSSTATLPIPAHRSARRSRRLATPRRSSCSPLRASRHPVLDRPPCADGARRRRSRASSQRWSTSRRQGELRLSRRRFESLARPAPLRCCASCFAEAVEQAAPGLDVARNRRGGRAAIRAVAELIAPADPDVPVVVDRIEDGGRALHVDGGLHRCRQPRAEHAHARALGMGKPTGVPG